MIDYYLQITLILPSLVQYYERKWRSKFHLTNFMTKPLHLNASMTPNFSVFLQILAKSAQWNFMLPTALSPSPCKNAMRFIFKPVDNYMSHGGRFRNLWQDSEFMRELIKVAALPVFFCCTFSHQVRASHGKSGAFGNVKHWFADMTKIL